MEIIILLLPSIVCLVVTCIIWSRQHLTLSSRFFIVAMLSCTFYLLFDALICFPHTAPSLLVWVYIGMSFLTPVIHLTMGIAAWTLITQRQHFLRRLFWLYTIPVVLCAFQVLISFEIIGPNTLAEYIESGHLMPMQLGENEMLWFRIYRVLTTDGFIPIYCATSLSCCIYLIYVLHKSDFSLSMLKRFLFAKGTIRPMHLLILFYFANVFCSLIRIHDGRETVPEREMPFYCIVFSIQAIFLAMMGLALDNLKKPCLSLRDTHRTPYFDDMPIHVSESESRVATDDLADEESDSYRILNLRDDLKLLMHQRACYLQPGMSRYSVSSHLGLSRRSFDHLIFLLYHVAYEDYVRVQRIQYCLRYKQQYPRASKIDVAMACGFPNVCEMDKQLEEWQQTHGEKDKKPED